MESPGDEGANNDQGGAGSDVHGDQTKQAALGSDCYPDEGQGPQPQRRAVQVQMEEPRHPLQGINLKLLNLQNLIQNLFQSKLINGFPFGISF